VDYRRPRLTINMVFEHKSLPEYGTSYAFSDRSLYQSCGSEP
jgi:hypothetical protein